MGFLTFKIRKVYAKFLLAIGEYSATLGIIDEAICLIVEQEGEEGAEGAQGDREGDEETGKTSTEAAGQVKECPVAVVT